MTYIPARGIAPSPVDAVYDHGRNQMLLDRFLKPGGFSAELLLDEADALIDTVHSEGEALAEVAERAVDALKAFNDDPEDADSDVLKDLDQAQRDLENVLRTWAYAANGDPVGTHDSLTCQVLDGIEAGNAPQIWTGRAS